MLSHTSLPLSLAVVSFVAVSQCRSPVQRALGEGFLALGPEFLLLPSSLISSLPSFPSFPSPQREREEERGGGETETQNFIVCLSQVRSQTIKLGTLKQNFFPFIHINTCGGRRANAVDPVWLHLKILEIIVRSDQLLEVLGILRYLFGAARYGRERPCGTRRAATCAEKSRKPLGQRLRPLATKREGPPPLGGPTRCAPGRRARGHVFGDHPSRGERNEEEGAR